MAKITERDIVGLSEVELNALPFGIIRLDKTGKILYYNQAQADLAHRTIATTVGLNFFSDVAPCASVKSFQGRFNEFLTAPGSRIVPFEFLFRFDWGTRKVSITMVKRAEDDTVFIETAAEAAKAKD